MRVLGRYGSVEAWGSQKGELDLCNGGDRRYYSCLEHLYALSRVSDLLLVPFEPVRPELLKHTEYEEDWHPSAAISAEERQAWWLELGMMPIDKILPFHPFYHEIVSVEQADDPKEPISLTGTIWTGFMLGSDDVLPRWCERARRPRSHREGDRRDFTNLLDVLAQQSPSGRPVSRLGA